MGTRPRVGSMTFCPGSNAESASADRKGCGGFTLLELLVVISIIAILLVAIAPAVNSLAKSSGRKATASLLLSAIEQARTQAIKDARPTYVAFPGVPADSS